MDNFLDLAKNLVQPQNLAGAIGGQVFQKSTAAKTPKPKILSSSVKISLWVNGPNGSKTELSIGELDDFNARKSLNVVKKFKPFGSKTEQVIVEDSSWELSFGGTKVDWKAGYLFYMTELALLGHNKSNAPKTGNTLGASNTLYISPTYEIQQQTNYSNGVIEIYTYHNVTLLDYDISIVGDNDVIPERFSATARDRTIYTTASDLETSKITNSIDTMLGIIKDSGRF